MRSSLGMYLIIFFTGTCCGKGFLPHIFHTLFTTKETAKEQALKEQLNVSTENITKSILAFSPVVAAIGLGAAISNRNSDAVGVMSVVLITSFFLKQYMGALYRDQYRELYRQKLYDFLDNWDAVKDLLPDSIIPLMESGREQYSDGKLHKNTITDDQIQQLLLSIGSVPQKIERAEDINKLLFTIDELGMNPNDFSLLTTRGVVFAFAEFIASGIIPVWLATLVSLLFITRGRYNPSSLENLVVGLGIFFTTLHTLNYWYVKIYSEYDKLFDSIILFLRHWPVYRSMTPEVLHESFTRLHTMIIQKEHFSYATKVAIYTEVKSLLERAKHEESVQN